MLHPGHLLFILALVNFVLYPSAVFSLLPLHSPCSPLPSLSLLSLGHDRPLATNNPSLSLPGIDQTVCNYLAHPLAPKLIKLWPTFCRHIDVSFKSWSTSTQASAPLIPIDLVAGELAVPPAVRRGKRGLANSSPLVNPPSSLVAGQFSIPLPPNYVTGGSLRASTSFHPSDPLPTNNACVAPALLGSPCPAGPGIVSAGLALCIPPTRRQRNILPPPL